MDVFTFVIIVVIIGCGTGVLTEYFKTKREASAVTKNSSPKLRVCDPELKSWRRS